MLEICFGGFYCPKKKLVRDAFSAEGLINPDFCLAPKKSLKPMLFACWSPHLFLATPPCLACSRGGGLAVFFLVPYAAKASTFTSSGNPIALGAVFFATVYDRRSAW